MCIIKCHTSLTVAFLLICFNSKSQDKNHTLASTLDVYKHYKGTVRARPISLDLRYGIDGGSNYGGSNFYYHDNSEMGRLIFPFPGKNVLPGNASEFPVVDISDNDREAYEKPHPKWNISMTGNKISGQRIDASGNQRDNIDLVEDYSSSYKMDIMRFADKIVLVKSDGTHFSVETYSRCVTPARDMSPNDADFINQALIKFCRADTIGVTDWHSYSKTYLERYADEIRKNKDKIPVDTSYENYGSSYSCNFMAFPDYNENGILVLDITWSSLSFPEFVITHGYVFNIQKFLCLDVSGKRVLRISDILNIDTVKLSALLEKEARKKLSVSPGVPLTSTYPPEKILPYRYFITDHIPVTDNVAITQHGLIFGYNEKEVMNENLCIFLSYEQLRGLLKPDFKKRMYLK